MFGLLLNQTKKDRNFFFLTQLAQTIQIFPVNKKISRFILFFYFFKMALGLKLFYLYLTGLKKNRSFFSLFFSLFF